MEIIHGHTCYIKEVFFKSKKFISNKNIVLICRMHGLSIFFFSFKLVGTILFYQNMERLLQFTLPTSVTNTMNRMLRVNGMSKHLRVKD